MTDFLPETASQGAVVRAEQRFRRALSISLVAGLGTLVVLVVLSVGLYNRQQTYNGLVEHTYSSEAKIAAIATFVERAETARRGYLLSDDATYLTTYETTRMLLGPAVSNLAEFTADNPRQTTSIAVLRGLIEGKLEQSDRTIRLAHDGDREGARALFIQLSTQRLTQKLRDTLREMDAEERRLLKVRTADQQGSALVLLATMVGAMVLLAVLALGAVFLMRRFAEDLQRTQAALRRLNEGLEESVRDRTAELLRANEEIQRFAYIVSHDLRSPLVNVMGFTSELETATGPLKKLIAAADQVAPQIVTKEARAAVEEDLPESVSFIRSSTKKMDRLINAILRLSREGRRNLTPEPLAMDAVMGGVADSLVQLAEAKDAEIIVEGPLPDLVSDRVAVEQVFSNLVENAVKYLTPGKPGRVVVRGRRAGGRLLYEVEDNGRGVDPRDHERIFELFRRSGAQTEPGEGIGLAHVRALVYRLGGVITCTSELGQGAIFRVSLPARIEHDLGHAA